MHDDRRCEVFSIRDDESHSMISLREERCSILYSLASDHLKNFSVEIEDIIFGKGMIVMLGYKVVSHLDDVVTKVYMTIFKRVMSRLKATN